MTCLYVIILRINQTKVECLPLNNVCDSIEAHSILKVHQKTLDLYKFLCSKFFSIWSFITKRFKNLIRHKVLFQYTVAPKNHKAILMDGNHSKKSSVG